MHLVIGGAEMSVQQPISSAPNYTSVLCGRILPRSFYARPVLMVAKSVIGKVLVSDSPQGVASGRIVESEAYRGPEDRAAHSFGGRRTRRTEAMFGPAGHAYVFFVYGMHWHFNLVTGRTGEPHAVLIRAVEPIEGAGLMAERRGMRERRRELTDGPGKLCEAFAITGERYGVDLCKRGSLYLVDGPPPRKVARSPRIGVDYAGDWARRPWRFFDPESPYVSRRRIVAGSAGRRGRA
jgi:DNA-3-methyladenine glycosylase